MIGVKLWRSTSSARPCAAASSRASARRPRQAPSSRRPCAPRACGTRCMRRRPPAPIAARLA
eukprot:6233604-Alexandrium_andersonii.AAC.1